MNIQKLLDQVMDANVESIRSNYALMNVDYQAFLNYSSILSSCEVQLRLSLAKSETEKQVVLQQAPFMIGVNLEYLNRFDNFLEISEFPKPLHWDEIRAYAISIAR